jgi:hypothetical protein
MFSKGADFAIDIIATQNRYVYSNGSDLKNETLEMPILREEIGDTVHKGDCV